MWEPLIHRPFSFSNEVPLAMRPEHPSRQIEPRTYQHMIRSSSVYCKRSCGLSFPLILGYNRDASTRGAGPSAALAPTVGALKYRTGTPLREDAGGVRLRGGRGYSGAAYRHTPFGGVTAADKVGVGGRSNTGANT